MEKLSGNLISRRPARIKVTAEQRAGACFYTRPREEFLSPGRLKFQRQLYPSSNTNAESCCRSRRRRPPLKRLFRKGIKATLKTKTPLIRSRDYRITLIVLTKKKEGRICLQSRRLEQMAANNCSRTVIFQSAI